MAAAAGTDTLTAEPPNAGPGPARRRKRITLTVIGVAALVALTAGTVDVAAAHLRHRAEDAHRTDLVDAARAGVLALVDVHVDTADEDLDRLRELSTGRFASELSDTTSDLASALRDARVDSAGRIDSAALAEQRGESGVVLVAASAQVANVDSPEATTRTYRLRVTLDEVDGRLLMSTVEFVP